MSTNGATVRQLALLLILGLALVPLPATAAETAQVGEMFFCTFHEGKGWDDFDTATDLFNETTKHIGSGWEDVRAFVWRPLRSGVDFDFLWASYTDNLSAWGRTMDAYLASEEGMVADALWDTVADCDSALTFVELIYGAFPDTDTAGHVNALESYVCNLNEGKTGADLDAALELWKVYVKKLGLEIDVYMRTPLMSNIYDHSFFAVHQDLAAFAANTTSYLTGSGSAAVDEALNAVQECGSSLWTSWQVSPASD